MAEATFRKGKSKREMMPEICAVCGQVAVNWPKIRFSTIPWWALLFVFLGPAWVILVMIDTRKAKVLKLPLCRSHKRYWFRLKTVPMLMVLCVIFLSPFIISFALVASNHNIGVMTASGLLCISGICLIGQFSSMRIRRSIHPIQITDHSITLAGLDETFVAELTKMRGSAPRPSQEIES